MCYQCVTYCIIEICHVPSGWLGWGSQKEDEQNQVSKNRKLEEAYESTDLSMDCNLPDARRTIMSVTVSPLGDLAALVDAFGRVLLLECETFTIRRMWKGKGESVVVFIY